MEYCIQCMKPMVNGQCPSGCIPPKEPASHILPPGTLLNDRYLIGRMLGQGGFGITYIGRDQVLDIRVAIKEYYPSGFVTRNVTASQAVVATSQDKQNLLSQESEKFLAEARVLAKFIGEPGIVDVRDYFRANNTAYIVMEYLDGENLRDCVRRRGRLSPAETFALLEPVMRSLDKVHRTGLIHRDVSPDNVMLLSGGGVKLLDFGTARSASPYGEQSLSVMLKPGYAPEEQYRSKGSQGPWTDVYGLCATMYKCITGITPEDSLQRLYEDTVVPPSKLGIPILPMQESVLMMGMACRMKDRFQSIGALATALGIGGFAALPAWKESPATVLLSEEALPPEQTESIYRQSPPQPPLEPPGSSTEMLFHRRQGSAPSPYSAPPPQQPPAPPAPPKAPPELPTLLQTQPKKRAVPLTSILGGAAVVLVIAFAAFWMFRPSGNTTPDQSREDRSEKDHSSAFASDSARNKDHSSVSASDNIGNSDTLNDIEAAITQLMPQVTEIDWYTADNIPYQGIPYLEYCNYMTECWIDRQYYQMAGHCFEMVEQGFGGPITMVVGMEPDGTILGVVILDHNETQGTGTRAMTDSALEQYICLYPTDLDDVDAVSGATITSRAIKLGVYHAFQISSALDYASDNPA